MQQLPSASNSSRAADACAGELLSAVPAVMWFLRHQMRRHRHPGLTVPQLRALVFLVRHENASLSETAKHLGISLSAMSRMAEVLVKRGLMRRRSGAGDRRRVSLSLTGAGRCAFRAAHRATRLSLAARLGRLPDRDVSRLAAAMRLLVRVFAPDGEKPASAGRRTVRGSRSYAE